jgi:phosphatidylglycerol:prolipoprotein diacylglycerol transferase
MGKLDLRPIKQAFTPMYAAIPFPDLSPNLISLTIWGAEFALRWYALAYIVGIVIAWRLGVAAVRRPALWGGSPPMAPQQIEDMLTWIILGVILGGRLGYVLFYQPQYYMAHPAEILMVWQGGMAFHGGLLGVIIGAWGYTYSQGLCVLRSADLIAHAVAPGLMLGRLANFVNAELWGRQTDAPWGVIFPGFAAQDCANTAIGQCARHPSQLYEATLEGALLGAFLLWLVYRRGGFKQPGLITGVFLAGYGAARFTVELFRQPDAQFITVTNPLGHVVQFYGWGLTMGQLLCLPMIAIGVWFVLRARHRASTPEVST